MKNIAIALLLVTTLGTAANAATEAATKTDATLICRPASGSDQANASLKDSATDLVCKPFSIAMKMSDGTMHVIGSTSVSSAQLGPDLSHAVSPGQVNDAWVRYIDGTFHIDHSS